MSLMPPRPVAGIAVMETGVTPTTLDTLEQKWIDICSLPQLLVDRSLIEQWAWDASIAITALRAENRRLRETRPQG